jgi:hypothetical protein
VRRALLEESGTTLIELLVVSVLMITVLGATLTVFNTFETTTATNRHLNDAQDQVRFAVDGLAKELRNLASPTNELPEALNRAEPQDLVFLSVANAKPSGSANARNTRRVRYCVDGEGRLWRQEQTWTTAAAPAMPGGTDCPDSGWASQRVAADNIVNGGRAVFDYTPASAGLSEITDIASTLFVDVNPGRPPKETTLHGTVFLRNQNREPTASFSAEIAGGQILLNASQSTDPEGRGLEFYWYDEGTTENDCGTVPPEITGTGCVGVGIVFNYTPPAPGHRNVHVVARDPAGLTSTAATQDVCLPGAGVTC